MVGSTVGDTDADVDALMLKETDDDAVPLTEPDPEYEVQ